MKNIFYKVFLLVMSFFVCVGIFQLGYGVFAEPGSQDDPVIVKSYLDQIVIPQIKNYVDESIKALSNKIAHSGQGNNEPITTERFTVVSVKPGQKLIGGQGTEMILRRGKATVVTTEMGGIADVTSGVDLKNGAVPAEHLLIIPRDDGRGVAADRDNSEDVLIMVKGTYAITD